MMSTAQPTQGSMTKFICPECGHTYDEAIGNPREGFPAGTAFSDVPDDWTCPDCGVRDKVDFEAEDVSTFAE